MVGPPPPLLPLLLLSLAVGDGTADDVEDVGELIVADGRNTCGTAQERSETVALRGRIEIFRRHAARRASEGLMWSVLALTIGTMPVTMSK